MKRKGQTLEPHIAGNPIPGCSREESRESLPSPLALQKSELLRPSAVILNSVDRSDD